MGEVIPLHPNAEVIPFKQPTRHIDAVEAAVDHALYDNTKVIKQIPGGIVHVLDGLIQVQRIDEHQACELLDQYLETGDAEFILSMQGEKPAPVEVDPNQLSLFD